MTSLRWKIRITARLTMFRWRSAALLVFLSFAGTAIVSGLGTTYSSARTAYFQGLIAERGSPASVIIQAPDSLRQRLNDQSGLVAVATRDAIVTAGNSAVTAGLWTTSAPTSSFEYVVRGHRPKDSSEAAVSEFLSGSLNLSIGDTISFQSGTRVLRKKVVGFTRNPGDDKDVSVLLAPDEKAKGSASYWIASPPALASVRADPRLLSSLDSGELSLTSNRAALEEGGGALPGRIAPLGRTRWAVAGAFMVLALLVLSSLTKTARRDVVALSAVGLSEVVGWRLMCAAAGGLMTVSSLAGGLSATWAVKTFSGVIDKSFGTSWIGTQTSWIPLGVVALGYMLVPTVSLAVSRQFTRGLLANGSRGGGKGAARTRWVESACLIVGFILVMMEYTNVWTLGIPLLSTVIGSVMIAVGSNYWIGRWSRRRLPAAGRRIAEEYVVRRGRFVFLACLVAAMAAAYSLLTTHDATAAAAYSKPLQPAGSLLALQASSESVDKLLTRYESLGGKRARVYGMPNSPRGDIRGQYPDGTSGSRGDPIVAYVAFDDSLGTDQILAQPEVIGDRKVQLAVYTDEGTQRIGNYPASPDHSLGGNMPGVLLNPRGQVAEALGLRDSGFFEVAFMDFDKLDPRSAALMRGQIRRYAPSALLSQSDDVNPLRQDLTTARAVALLGAALSLVVFAVGALVVSLAYRRLRGLLFQLGASRSYRARLLTAVSLAEVPPLMLVVALMSLSIDHASSAPPGGHSGAIWTAPLLALIAAALISALHLLAVAPSDHREG